MIPTDLELLMVGMLVVAAWETPNWDDFTWLWDVIKAHELTHILDYWMGEAGWQHQQAYWGNIDA